MLASSAALILAILIVPVLLTMQFLADSNRPGFPFGVAAVGSLAPVNLITLFVPNFFGSLDHLYDYWGPDYDTMPRADWTDRAVDYLFIGTLPFLLIAWHGFGAGRLFARRARFILILLRLALAYALGRYTPFFALAFDSIPGVSLYRQTRRCDISDQYRACLLRRIFAAPLYCGGAATALPHTAEMAGARAHWRDRAFDRGFDRHRHRLFPAGRPR